MAGCGILPISLDLAIIIIATQGKSVLYVDLFDFDFLIERVSLLLV